MELKPLRPCCVPGCNDKTARRFGIPSDENVRLIWIERIKNVKLLGSKDLRFFRNHPVCKNHFADMCIDDAGRLKKYSLPTLNLPGYNEPSIEKNCFCRPETEHLYITPDKVKKIFKNLPTMATVDASDGASIYEEDVTPFLQVQKPNNVYKRIRKSVFTPEAEHPEDNKRKVVPRTNELTKIPELKIKAPEPEPSIEINEPVIEETTVRSVQILTDDGPCELCRICLKPAKDSLVKQGTIEKELTTILPAFNFDLYPNPKVCLDCVTTLNEAVAFHDRILESDILIGKYISSTLPNGRPLDILIVPPDIKEEDAVKILQKRDDSPREEVSTNDSTPPAIISEPIKRSPDREHCYARPPKLRKYNRSIETVDSILDSEGVSLSQLERKVRKWKRLDRWGKPPYLCEKCGQVYNTLSSYRSHLQAHRHQLSKYVCDICGLTLTNVNPYHHSLKHKTKNHKCKLCWKSFLSSVGLKNHEKRYHPDGVITMVQCEICGTHVKNFNLKLHCRKYHPKEPQTYECKVCYKTFAHKHYLKKHSIIHSDDIFQCEYCNKIMKRPDSLKKHIELYHLNQQGKHYCNICSKPFWNKYKLDSHTEMFHSHPNIVYECHICGHTFPIKILLKKHISTQHQKQFLCGLCEKHLPNIVQLRKHYKKEHPQYEFIEEVS